MTLAEMQELVTLHACQCPEDAGIGRRILREIAHHQTKSESEGGFFLIYLTEGQSMRIREALEDAAYCQTSEFESPGWPKLHRFDYEQAPQ